MTTLIRKWDSLQQTWGRAALILACTAGCAPAKTAVVAESVTLTPVADGLTAPVDLAVAPDGSGRLFIIEQVGRIRIVSKEGRLIPTPFLDIHDRIIELSTVYDERGLLTMAFHPDYRKNGRFFVYYTAPKGAQTPDDFNCETVLAEFRASPDNPDAADASSEQVLLRIAQPQSNHNGGQLVFGPDGFLYLSTGDGGAGNDIGLGHTDVIGNGQDKSSWLGKVLRLDVNKPGKYAVPADNPFVKDASARPEIWAYGFRNPWRFSIDDKNRMFVADVGQDLFEEVSIIGKGDNAGWRIREADHCFDVQHSKEPPEECAKVGADGKALTAPIIVYPHKNEQGEPVGISVCGGYLYRGKAAAGLRGQYVFGDFTTAVPKPDGSLFAAKEQNGRWTMRELGIAGSDNGRLNRFLLSIGQDAQGELYLLTSKNTGPSGESGVVFRIMEAVSE